MSLQAEYGLPRDTASRGRFSSLLISATSFLRGLPLFFAARPMTPLRVLCVMAFDTLHVLRYSERMPSCKLHSLAALLDFGACANAVFDRKDFCRAEYRLTQRILEDAGLRTLVAEFRQRLCELERKRPAVGHDASHFQTVVSYRESVIRVFLGMVAVSAIGNHCLDDGIQATYGDDLEILFRIVMLCQIIDDVLDYSTDKSAALPSFLTAATPLEQSIELTRSAAARYADIQSNSRWDKLFAFRIALRFVGIGTKVVLVLADCRWPTSPSEAVT